MVDNNKLLFKIVGPAQIRILKMEPCAEYKNLPMVTKIIPRMFNKTTQLIDGYLYTPIDLNDNVTVAIMLFRKFYILKIYFRCPLMPAGQIRKELRK